ncbi:hypothetical protein AB0395_32175 [Streptosporangium sp. NPDC051023]
MSGFLASVVAKAAALLLEALVMRIVQALALAMIRRGGLLPA